MKNILMATFWMFVFFSIFSALTMGFYVPVVLIMIILYLYSYITKKYTKDIFFDQQAITNIYKKSIFYKFFFKGIPRGLRKDVSDMERKNYSYRFMSSALLVISISILSIPITMQSPDPYSVVIAEVRIANIKNNLLFNHCGQKIVEVIYNDNTKEKLFCETTIKNSNKISKEYTYQVYISRSKKIIPFCNMHDTILAINGPGINGEYNNKNYKRAKQANIFLFTVGFVALFFSVIFLYPLFDTYKIRNNKGK